MKNILFFFCGKQAFRLRCPHNFTFSPEFFLGKKQKSKSENSPLAWDVLTISLPVPRSNPWNNDKFLIFLRGKTGVWREMSSQFRVISGAFFLRKKNQRRKWAIWLRRPHNFAACCAHKLMKKIRRKRIRFFKNGRLGWDVLTISPSRGFFVLLNKLEKRTFRLRRPHNFADQHGRRIHRYVSSTDVWLETSSRFRFQMCPKMKNILFFFLRKQAFRLRRPHNFAFSPEFFLGKKQKSKSENSPLAWDVLTISLPVPRSNPWNNDKFRIFLRGKTGVGRETSSQFRVISGAFFLTKKNQRRKWEICLRRPHNFAACCAHKLMKNQKKTDQIFQERAFGLRRPHNFAVSLVFVLLKKFAKRMFCLRRPHNFADRHGRRIDRHVS